MFAGFSGTLDDSALEQLKVGSDQMADAAIVVRGNDQKREQLVHRCETGRTARALHDGEHEIHAREATIDHLQPIDDVHAHALGFQAPGHFRQFFSARSAVGAPRRCRNRHVLAAQPGFEYGVGASFQAIERRGSDTAGAAACTQLFLQAFRLHARGEQAEAVGKIRAQGVPCLLSLATEEQVGDAIEHLCGQTREALDMGAGAVEPSQQPGEFVFVRGLGQELAHEPIGEIRDEAASAGQSRRAEQIRTLCLDEDFGNGSFYCPTCVRQRVEQVEHHLPSRHGGGSECAGFVQHRA